MSLLFDEVLFLRATHMTSGSGKNDKYAFLYDFAKGSFDGELQRYRNIEEKASRYMAFCLF